MLLLSVVISCFSQNPIYLNIQDELRSRSLCRVPNYPGVVLVCATIWRCVKKQSEDIL